MDVFKILVSAVIAGAIIYFIITTFVFKELDPNKVIESNINLAKESLGEPICSKISMKKNFELNPMIMKNDALFKNHNLDIVYFSNNTYLRQINTLFIASKNIRNLDFCSVCYPSYVFIKDDTLNSNYDLICETSFGSKIIPLNLNLLPYENISQGFYAPNYIGDLPQGYVYKAYIFNNESTNRYSKNNQTFFSSKMYSLEKDYSFYNKDENLEFSKSGEKIVLQLIVPENISLNNFIGAGKVLINSVTVNQNSEYQSLNCKATYSEKQYFNYEIKKCVQYNFCEGCILANHCVNAWAKKDLISEAYNPNYSISYINGEC
jgi:Pyruvate/2-oxoacid:ferredoxin oxidoreductase delta subunit